jgi:hypothetical protein
MSKYMMQKSSTTYLFKGLTILLAAALIAAAVWYSYKTGYSKGTRTVAPQAQLDEINRLKYIQDSLMYILQSRPVINTNKVITKYKTLESIKIIEDSDSLLTSINEICKQN